MRVKEHDESLMSNAYESLQTRWWRCREYAFYRKDLRDPLGAEIDWIENNITFRMLIPDVPVDFYGKTISLQKTVGMGVIESIRLLDITRIDTALYVVSIADPDRSKWMTKVVDFSGIDLRFALTDEDGLPIANKPSNPADPDARSGSIARTYGKAGTGWHGSLVRGICSDCGQRKIYADLLWSTSLGVTIVDREPDE